MADYTTNLNLEKPAGDENFRRLVLNDNMDKIDAAVATKETVEGAQAKADAVQANLNMHEADTTVAHGATSAAAAGKIIIRDAGGRAKVAAPSATDDIARKDTVDAVQTILTAHLADNTRHVTKDGTLQTGLNVEQLGGYYLDDIKRKIRMEVL